MQKSINEILQMSIDSLSLSTDEYENKYYPFAGPSFLIDSLTELKHVLDENKSKDIKDLVITIREEDPKYEDMILNGEEDYFCELAVNGELEHKLSVDQAVLLIENYFREKASTNNERDNI